MKKILACTLFLSLFALPALAAPLGVVTSFSILSDITKQVAGDLVDVQTFVGPDTDAHAFEPTPQDVKKLAAADIFIVNGLGFDPWVDKLASASGFKGKVVVASTGVTPRARGAGTDPHAWQDLRNGMLYADTIAAALQSALPAHKDAIQQRLNAYKTELAKLDSDFKAQMQQIPQAKRKIITAHDAFGYFGAAYGVAFLAPEGISTESQPSAADIAKLVRQMKDEGVKVVFLENQSAGRMLQQLAKDTGATVGGALYADALSGLDGPAATYTGMFKHNMRLLLDAMKR